MGMGREGWRQNYEGIGKHEDGRGTNEFDGGGEDQEEIKGERRVQESKEKRRRVENQVSGQRR